MLVREDYDLGLDPGVQELARLQPLLHAYRADELTGCAVAMRVNDPASDSPECVRPPSQRGSAGSCAHPRFS